MSEKEKIQELAGKLKGLLDDKSAGSFFIMSNYSFIEFCKLNEFSKEREIEFKRKHLIDICNGGYFMGAFSCPISAEFMVFSE